MLLTESQIKAQVGAIRKKAKSATAFALRTDTPWTGAPRLIIDGQPHRVTYCRSDLELREQLRAAAQEKEALVALCAFSTSALGDDVKARLAKHSVHPPDAKEILMSLFQATGIDARILKTPGLTQALIDHAPPEGYPPVAGGVLDLQSAWIELIERNVGSREVATSMGRLMEATLDAETRQRIEQMPTEMRRELFGWMALNVDPSAGWMINVIAAGRTVDLLPLGLFLDLVFDPNATATSVTDARVRLESWFAGHAIDTTVARSWAAAARVVIQSRFQQFGVSPALSSMLSRFDGLLQEFKVSELAVRSDFSPSGFELRIRAFAQVLAQFARGGASRDAKKLITAIDHLKSHLLAESNQRRIERCEMAARLACWLTDGARLATGTSFDEMIAGYERWGGFVDWARTIVREGDADASLNKAFDAILASAASVCDEFEASFAMKLAEWTTYGSKPSETALPIENALETLVGPIAAQTPVLLLVMDGMSVAVFRELIGDLVQRGKWLECRPASVAVPPALLATVPSVTEISRRALFRGKLQPESTPTEQSAFNGHDRLFSLSGGQARPVLLLKGGLQNAGEAGLSAEVKQAVANTKCRIVAAVLNAVDDHLSGSDQIAPRWDLDFIRPLSELLRLSVEAGRVIVFTSDHGHVLEHGTSLKSGMTAGGDRYREGGGPPVNGEIKISGSRVLQALGRSEITAAWSGGLRYASKKRGYHGGVSPQEMIIPLTVLRHLNSSPPEGWSDISPSPFRPEWWRLSGEAAAVAATRAEVEKTSKATAGLELFTHAAASTSATRWIDELLDGEVYREQCKQAVRGAPERQLVSSFLEVLSARGGSIPREALAERLGLPLLRLNGLIPNLARVFNVDGYDVVAMDSASGTVSLNIALLKKQFALAE